MLVPPSEKSLSSLFTICWVHREDELHNSRDLLVVLLSADQLCLNVKQMWPHFNLENIACQLPLGQSSTLRMPHFSIFYILFFISWCQNLHEITFKYQEAISSTQTGFIIQAHVLSDRAGNLEVEIVITTWFCCWLFAKSRSTLLWPLEQ